MTTPYLLSSSFRFRSAVKFDYQMSIILTLNFESFSSLRKILHECSSVKTINIHFKKGYLSILDWCKMYLLFRRSIENSKKRLPLISIFISDSFIPFLSVLSRLKTCFFKKIKGKINFSFDRSKIHTSIFFHSVFYKIIKLNQYGIIHFYTTPKKNLFYIRYFIGVQIHPSFFLDFNSNYKNKKKVLSKKYLSKIAKKIYLLCNKKILKLNNNNLKQSKIVAIYNNHSIMSKTWNKILSFLIYKIYLIDQRYSKMYPCYSKNMEFLIEDQISYLKGNTELKYSVKDQIQFWSSLKKDSSYIQIRSLFLPVYFTSLYSIFISKIYYLYKMSFNHEYKILKIQFLKRLFPKLARFTFKHFKLKKSLSIKKVQTISPTIQNNFFESVYSSNHIAKVNKFYINKKYKGYILLNILREKKDSFFLTVVFKNDFGIVSNIISKFVDTLYQYPNHQSSFKSIYKFLYQKVEDRIIQKDILSILKHILKWLKKQLSDESNFHSSISLIQTYQSYLDTFLIHKEKDTLNILYDFITIDSNFKSKLKSKKEKYIQFLKLKNAFYFIENSYPEKVKKGKMYCIHCHFSIEGSYRYCIRCGEQFPYTTFI